MKTFLFLLFLTTGLSRAQADQPIQSVKHISEIKRIWQTGVKPTFAQFEGRWAQIGDAYSRGCAYGRTDSFDANGIGGGFDFNKNSKGALTVATYDFTVDQGPYRVSLNDPQFPLYTVTVGGNMPDDQSGDLSHQVHYVYSCRLIGTDATTMICLAAIAGNKNYFSWLDRACAKDGYGVAYILTKASGASR